MLFLSYFLISLFISCGKASHGPKELQVEMFCQNMTGTILNLMEKFFLIVQKEEVRFSLQSKIT